MSRLKEHGNRPNVKDYMAWRPDAVLARLVPSVHQRIADMDAAEISVSVLSAPLPAPGSDGVANAPAPVQPLDESAIPLVQPVNEELYEMVSAYPDRFAAFATLPMGLPDEREFAPVLEAAGSLDVPINIHPSPPPQRVSDIYYTGLGQRDGQMLSCSGLGWHLEMSVHVTRLILSSVFDRIPRPKSVRRWRTIRPISCFGSRCPLRAADRSECEVVVSAPTRDQRRVRPVPNRTGLPISSAAQRRSAPSLRIDAQGLRLPRPRVPEPSGDLYRQPKPDA